VFSDQSEVEEFPWGNDEPGVKKEIDAFSKLYGDIRHFEESLATCCNNEVRAGSECFKRQLDKRSGSKVS